MWYRHQPSVGDVRLLLAGVLGWVDLELMEDSEDWLESCRIVMPWLQAPLLVK
jgi:hypothetical protein